MRSEWRSQRGALNSAALQSFLGTVGAMHCCLTLLMSGAMAYGLVLFAACSEWYVASHPSRLSDDEMHPKDLDDYAEARAQWEADWIHEQRRRLGFSVPLIDITGSPPPFPMALPKTWGERKKKLTPDLPGAEREDDYPVTEDPDVH